MEALLKSPGVIIFLTNQFPLSDGGPTYRDQTHLSSLGSMFFSPYYQSGFGQQY
jgi:hypothetical protein